MMMKAGEGVRYWLCCGSQDPNHRDRSCMEAKVGHPERCRFGTAAEHSEWQAALSVEGRPAWNNYGESSSGVEPADGVTEVAFSAREKDCHNCKHRPKPRHDWPCRDCTTTEHWTPAAQVRSLHHGANRMTHTIFAWTEPTPPEGFPAYVNISRDENGKHTITVRSRGNGGQSVSTVEVTTDVLGALFDALQQDCGDEGFYCGDPECDACVPPVSGVAVPPKLEHDKHLCEQCTTPHACKNRLDVPRPCGVPVGGNSEK